LCSRLLGIAFLLAFLQGHSKAGENAVATPPASTRQFEVKGVVKKIEPETGRVFIKHEAIPNFMDAMTMPFTVKDRANLAAFQPGDFVSFKLSVSAEQSWISDIVKLSSAVPDNANASQQVTEKGSSPAPHPHNPLLNYAFTNELGQPVRLGDFHGQILALTFFFSRCPLPDYCPRLSKNFEEASRQLRGLPGAPTNYHFLSVTFDPEFDTPARLKVYAEQFGYDPSHWSFLTGASNQVAELARLSDFRYQRDGVFFNHDLRTLIIDADGRLRMKFPMGGNLAGPIVEEIVKAAKPREVSGVHGP
jgi:protein SCO1/2